MRNTGFPQNALVKKVSSHHMSWNNQHLVVSSGIFLNTVWPTLTCNVYVLPETPVINTVEETFILSTCCISILFPWYIPCLFLLSEAPLVCKIKTLCMAINLLTLDTHSICFRSQTNLLLAVWPWESPWMFMYWFPTLYVTSVSTDTFLDCYDM